MTFLYILTRSLLFIGVKTLSNTSTHNVMSEQAALIWTELEHDVSQ